MYESGQSCDKYAISRMWTAERPEWSKEVYRLAQTRAILNLADAFKKFFKKQCKHPQHHKKGKHESFYVANDQRRIYADERRIMIPGVGHVKMTEDFRFPDSKIMYYIVTHTPADQWYVTVVCVLPDKAVVPRSDDIIGVDIGFKDWAVASSGEVLTPPKRRLKRLYRKLAKRQRALARSAKGSKRRLRKKIAAARTYRRITCIKQDIAHKFSTMIANNHGTVVLEKLDIQSMQQAKSKSTRKGAHQSCAYALSRMLEYKCSRTIRVSQFFPSSKMCSRCGEIGSSELTPDRKHKCTKCGLVIDRDINAAINLREEGLRIISGGHPDNACGRSR